MTDAAARWYAEVHVSHVRLGFVSGNCPHCDRIRADRRRSRLVLPGESEGRRFGDRAVTKEVRH